MRTDPTSPSRGVLVTGSSRGVGAAIARAFARLGDRVVVHYGGSAQAAQDVYAGLPGDGHALVQADLADPDAVRRLADESIAALGRVDVLVNNAGIFEAHPIEDTDYDAWVEAWERTLATNLMGPANLVHQVARHMIAVPPAGSVPVGRIVNVGSRGAYRGEPLCPAYGASKAGLHALGQSMALQLGRHGIAVTSVAPGFIETDMAGAHLDGELGDATRGQSPFGRVARPEEIADAVVALASPAAEWASGAVIDLNGASHLR